MKKSFLAVIVGIGSFLCGTACSPSEPSPVALAPDVVESYLLVASQVSRYPLTAARPVVLVKPHEWFIENECDGIAKGCTVVGAFGPDEPLVIYVNAATPLDSQPNTLVHELVHFLQYQNGKMSMSTCEQRALIEAEAYVAAYRFDLEYIGKSAEPLDTTLSNCTPEEAK